METVKMLQAMRRVLFIVIASLLALPPAAPAQAESQALTFGIVPQQSASKLASTWGPVLAEISAKAGVKIEFRTAPDIPTFEQRLAAGEYDFAYMNPYHYTIFHERPGYRAVAREENRKIQGIIVVRADSPIQSIEQLQGQTLAFPAPAAFAASVLPRAALRQKNIAFQTKYVSSHDSVYFSVADGLFPAGGGIMRTLETVSPDTQAALRVLWRTNSFTPHAIAAHPRVSEQMAKSVVGAMTALDQSEAGKALLAAIGFTGVEGATNADWDDIRKLGITPAEASGQ
jgi:phosphonate transport system substrate-binding protein